MTDTTSRPHAHDAVVNLAEDQTNTDEGWCWSATHFRLSVFFLFRSLGRISNINIFHNLMEQYVNNEAGVIIIMRLI